MNCKRCNRPIDDHTEGRETDKCVIECVMGIGWFYNSDDVLYACTEEKAWVFKPSTDHNDAHKMEERIAELGLETAYVKHLYGFVENAISYHLWWVMAHASALDRCKAALMAMCAE